MKKGLTAVGITVASLLLCAVAAFGAAADTPAPAPATAPAAIQAPAQLAGGVCAADSGLAAVFQQSSAPLSTRSLDLAPAPTASATCTSCFIRRGCFSVCPALIEQAPCAETVCCGVVVNRVCGSCSTDCVPPPG